MTFEKNLPQSDFTRKNVYLRRRIIINALCFWGWGGGSSVFHAGVPQGFIMEPLFFSVFLLITEVLLGALLESF